MKIIKIVIIRHSKCHFKDLYLFKLSPMKYFLTTLALTLVSITWSQQTNETIDIGGVTREYIQNLPVAFDPINESLPVVFCLHGLGSNAQVMTAIGFNQIGDTARFITIYPEGVVNTFGQASWSNGTLLASTAADFDFFNNLIDDMVLNYNADPSRIYFSGFSMGSIMSYKLACELNGRIAAIGTMSGTMSTEDVNNCVPTYLTPVIHFHGTIDPTVPYDSGALPSLSLVPETIEFWRNAHNCSVAYDSTQIPDIAADGLTVDRFVYQNCTPLNSLEFWRINGGEHDYFYEPVNDFTEAVEIWNFFSQWSHPNPESAGILSLGESPVQITPNPSLGIIDITVEKNDKLLIHSSVGKSVYSGDINSGLNTVDVSYLEPGVYMVQLKSRPTYSKRIVIQ